MTTTGMMITPAMGMETMLLSGLEFSNCQLELTNGLSRR